MLGTTEILIIGGLVILLFGGKKLPEIARSLGSFRNEFNKASNELDADAKSIKQSITNE